jgi:hypothetical protein
MMMMVVVAVVMVATVPIIRPIVVAIVWLIVGVRAVRIIVPIRVISVVVARKSVPNAEVHLSIGTWCRHEGQAPCHECD